MQGASGWRMLGGSSPTPWFMMRRLCEEVYSCMKACSRLLIIHIGWSFLQLVFRSRSEV